MRMGLVVRYAVSQNFLYGRLSPSQILLRRHYDVATGRILYSSLSPKSRQEVNTKMSSLFASRALYEHRKFLTEQRHHYLPL